MADEILAVIAMTAVLGYFGLILWPWFLWARSRPCRHLVVGVGASASVLALLAYLGFYGLVVPLILNWRPFANFIQPHVDDRFIFWLCVACGVFTCLAQGLLVLQVMILRRRLHAALVGKDMPPDADPPPCRGRPPVW